MQKNYLIIVLAFLIAACGKQEVVEEQVNTNIPQPREAKPSPYERYKVEIDRLTLREKIGQTVILLVRAGDLVDEYGSIANFVEKYPVGGIFVGASKDHFIEEEKQFEQIRKLIGDFSEASKIPILVQQDFEYGLGQIFDETYTHLPHLMGLGATQSPELAYDYGKTIGLEVNALGFRWVLNPVADININPLSPIANTRSLTDDPDLAISMLSQLINGLQDNGVAATIKHFPGDGMDFRDQHLVVSENDLSEQEWWQVHGKVFQALIDSGVYSIMPGHITLPFYQKEKWKGYHPPATLSKELITDLLKRDMGFQGVVVSDAMIMAGFRSFYDDQMERQMKSFEAGVDMMLWPSNDYVDTLEARILAGKISEDRLNDAVGRIWDLKKKLGLFDGAELFKPLTEKEKAFAANTAKKVAEASLTTVRNEASILPLSPEKDKVLLFNLAFDDSKTSGKNKMALDYTHELLKEKGFEVDYFQKYPIEGKEMWDESQIEGYDAVVFMLGSSPHFPMGTLLPDEVLARAIWGINSLPKEKVIVVSYGTPYLIPHYLYQVTSSVNAYSNARVVQEAVADYLMTGRALTGESPVALK